MQQTLFVLFPGRFKAVLVPFKVIDAEEKKIDLFYTHYTLMRCDVLYVCKRVRNETISDDHSLDSTVKTQIC
jgi:hypothetical protein